MKRKSPKKPLPVVGVKIDDLTIRVLKDVDPRKLTTSELKTVVDKMTQLANNRIRIIERAGLAKSSPALKWLRGGEKHLGKIHYFDTKLKDPWKDKDTERKYAYYRDQLLAKSRDLYTFLFEAKTSTVPGIREYRKELSQRLPGYWELSRARKNDFWDAYHRLLETREGGLVQKDADQGGVKTSSEAQAMLFSEMKPGKFKNADDAIQAVQDKLNEEYEKLEEEKKHAEETNPMQVSMGSSEEGDQE